MSDSITAVSWHDDSGGHIRVYVVNGETIDEYMFDGSWRKRPFTAEGTSVAAIAVRDTTGHVHRYVFTGNGGTITEHRWEEDQWKPGTLRVSGVAAAATAFISGSGQLIMRVYAREDGGVREHCWDDSSSWYPGWHDAAAVADSLAAVSWREVFRVYLADGTKVNERAWHYSWRSGTSFDGRTALAATSWQRDPDKPEIAVYIGNGTEISEQWWDGSQWLPGTFPQATGVAAAATSWFDASLYIRTYIRDAGGAVLEYQWNDGTGWTRTGPIEPASIEPPSLRWFIDGTQLRVSTLPDPFRIRGVCYSRTLCGEEGPADSIHADSDIWRADLDAMRAMGVNIIKIYGMSMDRVRERKHQDFLDHAWNNGDHPIYVVLSLWIEPLLLGLRKPYDGAMRRQLELWRAKIKRPDADPETELKQLREDYLTLVQTYGSRPAVMGFSIGAEVNVPGEVEGGGVNSLLETAEFWNDFLDIAQHIRAAASGRILTTGLIDHPPSIEACLTENAKRSPRPIDVWGVDFYKDTFWMSDTFRAYERLIRRYDPSAPLLVAEFGYPASDGTGGQDSQLSHLAAVWSAIGAAAGFVCGGCIFEWADEWWKDGRPELQNEGRDTLFTSHAGIPVRRNEEWFGINALEPSTKGRTLVPRRAYDIFQSLWR